MGNSERGGLGLWGEGWSGLQAEASLAASLDTWILFFPNSCPSERAVRVSGREATGGAFEGPGFKWSGGQGRSAALALAGGVGVRARPSLLAWPIFSSEQPGRGGGSLGECVSKCVSLGDRA